ncbi:MarC family protein [Desulfoluna sp.]|uniref:MarC family protein n=1 Tax=Desulfoluna sp. TaxID=2045199 RepID=UPI00261A4FE6|nr:MarC family protein [Desulfoluna sp.]
MPVETFLHALTSYFVIIDPLGAAIIFFALTNGKGQSYRRNMAVKSVAVSTCIILAFGFFGEAILSRLGISIEALRVAGGFLLFYTAFHMITGAESQPGGGAVQGLTDISVYPMSIPLLSGPGCLTLTILLFSGASGTLEVVSVMGAVVIINTVTFIAFLYAGAIMKCLGGTGDDIIKRLFGVILAALAIQFIADGIRQLAGMQ